MSAAVLAVSIVPTATAVVSAAIWSVRTARGPAPATVPVRHAPHGLTAREISAVLAVALGAIGLVAVSIRHGSTYIQFERSIDYTAVIFLVPAVAWRAVRLVRPGAAAIDRLATAATLVTGGALLVGAVSYAAVYIPTDSTVIGFVGTGLLTLAGALSWLLGRTHRQ